MEVSIRHHRWDVMYNILPNIWMTPGSLIENNILETADYLFKLPLLTQYFSGYDNNSLPISCHKNHFLTDSILCK